MWLQYEHIGVTGIYDGIYYNNLAHTRLSLLALIIKDISIVPNLSDKLIVIFSYFMNIVAVTILMLFPVYIWYILYDFKYREIPNYSVAIFFSA